MQIIVLQANHKILVARKLSSKSISLPRAKISSLLGAAIIREVLLAILNNVIWPKRWFIYWIKSEHKTIDQYASSEYIKAKQITAKRGTVKTLMARQNTTVCFLSLLFNGIVQESRRFGKLPRTRLFSLPWTIIFSMAGSRLLWHQYLMTCFRARTIAIFTCYYQWDFRETNHKLGLPI